MAERGVESLYTWQRDCLRTWLANHGRGIVHVATGAGKTVLALACAQTLQKQCGGQRNGAESQNRLKVKIVVPQVFMLAQWREVILREMAVRRADIGVCHGGRKGGTAKPITLYVLNSARYTLAKDIIKDLRSGNPVLLICDECHHMGSPENAKCFDFIPLLPSCETPFYSLGLSATPDSPGLQEVLIPALGGEIYQYDITDAWEEGVVSRCRLVNVALRFTPEESREYGELTETLGIKLCQIKSKAPYLQALAGRHFFARLQKYARQDHGEISALAGAVLGLSYRRKELVYLARERQTCACGLMERLAGRRRVLVFGERIDMCETLYTTLNARYPGQVRRYHSQMTVQARQTALSDYESGRSDILISCRAFDEGLDVPDTDAGIVLSSTGSTRQRIQRVGRLLRTCAGSGVKTMYYLYIPESGEETSLLTIDGQRNAETYALRFDSETGEFCNDHYDALCGRLVEALSEKNLTDREWDAVLHGLRTGAVCGDWQLGVKECRRRVETAKDVDERNYWIVMWRLGRLWDAN